ncbi:autotransporter assembly complex protein TamA [Gilvimarinus sp. F26214L]|uniref:autotransporter assembly complex protein TamA n=1 Tax=Gilvimarinus sp. DZF01 TaxID=3461371 RepID=UPI0040460F39
MLLGLLVCVGWPLSALAIPLQVEGAPSDLEENIRLHLSKWDQLPAQDVEEVRDTVQPTVTEALQALGYYRAEVEYGLDGESLILNVAPGPRVRWGEVDIQVLRDGEPSNALFREQIASHPFRPGQPFSHQTYENYKSELLSFATRQGYLDARLVRNRLRINPQIQEAEVILHAELGDRYSIVDATFSESRLRPELVQGIAQVPDGSWYSADLVGEIYNRLLNSGYFAGVNITVDTQAPDRAYLHIELEDLARHRVSTGVGFGTDIGAWVKLRWERPALNDRGHNLLAELRLSQVSQEVFTQYKIPRGHPQNEFVSWDNGWRQQDIEGVETEVFTTGLSYHRVYGESWRYSLHVDLENETSRIGDEPEQDTSYVIPSVRLSRRFFSGDAADPNFGYRYWLHLATSDDSLGSDTDFHRINSGVNTLFTFFERHSLLGRIEYGRIETDEFGRTPVSQRFYTGGDQSVRGFDFESIAPREPDGDLIGGQRLNVASLEYRYRFLPTWQAAVFVDTGRSYLDENFESDLSGTFVAADRGEDYRTGAGLGVRWRSPVGFIAFDVAAPVDDPLESGVRVHLYLGTPL